ncbi:MAG TPA: hypothetical protein VF692_01660 [Pyrinomonadaceae bacterium]|jgi:hypothetical protein
MRSKTILSVAAFIVAFAFSTAFAGLFIAKSAYQSVLTAAPVVSYNEQQPTSCFKKRGRYTADKIEVFVSQDDSIGQEHQQINTRIARQELPLLKSPLFFEYKTAVAEYVEASDSMDESTMPHEFQTAWRAHTKAWRDYADFLDLMKSGSKRAQLTDEEAYEMEKPFQSEIANTYYEVLRVGRSYGAEVY